MERTPEAVALVFEGQSLTYRELDARANQLAWHLRSLGVGPEVRVGLCVERSLEMVIALLATLKAGGAYVPLDPDYPSQRLVWMLEDARPAVLLAQQRLLSRLPPHEARVLCLDSQWNEVAAHPRHAPPPLASPDNLAYIIFTSGSTGRPKGAMNAHAPVVNRLLWMQEEYGLGPQDTVLQKTPFSFDVSVWEFFWPLMVGARLVVARPGGHQEPAYLVRLIAEARVTTLHFVPSMLQVFLEEPGLERCVALRRVVCSGEALPLELAERCLQRLPQAGLHNLYGPTEAAVDVTYYACVRGEHRRSVPIGRPVANTSIRLLDPKLRPVPIGVPGELFIGGVQVGRGYLSRPELTAERFIPDPFSETPGARMYRTGDVARWLPDGNVEYLGRADFQVKIRGLRIELGEIESVLEQHPTVQQAVVMAREDVPGDKRLVAYVAGRGGVAAVDPEALNARLREKLPEYMVPSALVVLEALPLNPNGKVDRKALPAPKLERTREEPVAPSTPTEAEVAALFSELLHVERVGAQDDLFKLGGNSLMATRVVARLRARFGVELPVRVLFQHSTVQQVARLVDEARSGGESKQERASGPKRRERLPVVPLRADDASGDTEEESQEQPRLTAEERHRLLVEWNATAADFPREACIHHLVEAQARRTPEAVAVSAGLERLTYRELDTRANRLASYLRSLGVGPEVRVGLCVERYADMVVGMLAILKAGGAYVPLDPTYPRERLAFLLEDARGPALLAHSHLQGALPPHGSPRWSAWTPCPRPWPPARLAAARRARSREPRLPHLHLGQHGPAQGRGHHPPQRRGLPLVGPGHLPSRDAAGRAGLYLHQLRPVRLRGLRSVELWRHRHRRPQRAAPGRAAPGLRGHPVNTVPSAMAQLLRLGALPASVRTINLAGEPLPEPLARQVYDVPTVKDLNNLYGPSEDTTYSTWVRVRPGEPVTIGRPLSNTQAYVLDEHLEPVPVGMPGELYLGGRWPGARLPAPPRAHRRALPAVTLRPAGRAHVPDGRPGALPAGRRAGLPGPQRLPGEDARLPHRAGRGGDDAAAQHPGVREAVVVVREDVPGDKRLVAYAAFPLPPGDG